MPITTPEHLLLVYGGDAEHFAHVLEFLFTPALQRLGYEVLPPAVSGSDVIHAEVIRRLETADLVLCDLSTLNSNVFFELGIRTALDKPVCLVKDRCTVAIPFDTTIVNHWTYDHALSPWTLPNEIIGLHTHLTRSLNTSTGRNSMWKLFGLTMRASQSLPTEGDAGKIDAILQLLQNLRNVMESPLAVVPPPGSRGDLRTGVFLRQAQDIAGRVNAKFRVSKVDEEHNTIVLDLGPFILGNREIEEVKALGGQCGFDVTIEGGANKQGEPAGT
jgi:hypothetical protein